MSILNRSEITFLACVAAARDGALRVGGGLEATLDSLDSTAAVFFAAPLALVVPVPVFAGARRGFFAGGDSRSSSSSSSSETGLFRRVGPPPPFFVAGLESTSISSSLIRPFRDVDRLKKSSSAPVLDTLFAARDFSRSAVFVTNFSFILLISSSRFCSSTLLLTRFYAIASVLIQRGEIGHR